MRSYLTRETVIEWCYSKHGRKRWNLSCNKCHLNCFDIQSTFVQIIKLTLRHTIIKSEVCLRLRGEGVQQGKMSNEGFGGCFRIHS